MSDIWNHEADAWDDLVCFVGANDDDGYVAPKLKTCSICGTRKLHWSNTNGVFHLAEHNCFNKLMQNMRKVNNVSSTRF